MVNEIKIREIKDTDGMLEIGFESRIFRVPKKFLNEYKEGIIGIERIRIKEEVKKHPRRITEEKLNEMENIELSYTGEMIPVEVIDEICS